MNLYYENHLGEKIYFYRSPYILTQHSFFNWTIAYSLVNNKSGGYKINAKELPFTVRIMPQMVTAEAQAASFADLIDHFVEVVSADGDTPGKMWTDSGEYMVCRIVTSEKANWNISRNVTLSCVLQSDNPVWLHSDKYEISFTPDTEYEYLDYPYGFEYDYKGTLLGCKILENESTEPCDFIITIYGATYYPKIRINGIDVGANVIIPADGRLVINSQERTVKKYSGIVVSNEFNNRLKGQISMFTPLPPGQITILWSGVFDFDFEVIEKRREPSWN